MNTEGVMEFETHHLTRIVVITDSGKNHQWTLKQVGKSLLRKVTIPLVSKALPPGAPYVQRSGLAAAPLAP